MQATINLSFVAPDAESFALALAALNEHKGTSNVSIVAPAVSTLPVSIKATTESVRGHYEGILWDKGRRVRYTEQAAAAHGTKEAYCLSILKTEFPELVQAPDSPADAMPAPIASEEQEPEPVKAIPPIAEFEGSAEDELDETDI